MIDITFRHDHRTLISFFISIQTRMIPLRIVVMISIIPTLPIGSRWWSERVTNSNPYHLIAKVKILHPPIPACIIWSSKIHPQILIRSLLPKLSRRYAPGDEQWGPGAASHHLIRWSKIGDSPPTTPTTTSLQTKSFQGTLFDWDLDQEYIIILTTEGEECQWVEMPWNKSVLPPALLCWCLSADLLKAIH